MEVSAAADLAAVAVAASAAAVAVAADADNKDTVTFVSEPNKFGYGPKARAHSLFGSLTCQHLNYNNYTQ